MYLKQCTCDFCISNCFSLVLKQFVCVCEMVCMWECEQIDTTSQLLMQIKWILCVFRSEGIIKLNSGTAQKLPSQIWKFVRVQLGAVFAMNYFIPADAEGKSRGTQQSSAFMFLAVRLLKEWEGCDNGGLINLTKTTSPLQYLIYPYKATQRTQFSVLRGCLCFYPCEGQEDEETPWEVRTCCWCSD